MAHASHDGNIYYVPHGTWWPIIGSIGLFALALGAAMALNRTAGGGWISILGALMLLYMIFGWFRTVIGEAMSGLYNAQVDRTYRWAMGWFIFSEVMFFGAFFGALFYARQYAVPWLGGSGDELMTHLLIWPDYDATWPTNGPGDVGGHFERMGAWGLPAINTAILLTSSWTVTLAHHAIKDNALAKQVGWLALTVLLAVGFLGLQAYEYYEAYAHMGLTLNSGIYGSTFFMLTGFHGAHVTLGTIMLAVMLYRAARAHFSPDDHFAFEAVAWYWHFVDVVWLGLFIFVYIL